MNIYPLIRWMSGKKIIFILWLMFMVASVTSFFLGESGLLAMRKLETERDRIAANMESLRSLNGELEASLSSLQSDTDMLSVYARELGYAGSPNEHFIRIRGLQAATRRTAHAGNLLRAERPGFVSAASIRIFSLLSGLTLAIFLFCSEKREKKPGKREARKL